MAFNPNLPGQVPFRASKMPGFFFRKRVERIDWKRLASVDVCRVASQMDIDALQDNLVSVAFCDINSEIDTRYVDTNFIKLFQLAQLLIEYLLYSQDYLTNTVDSLRLENETIKKETDALKKRLEQQAQRLTSTRKECHRRRLLLLAQQRLMNSGPQSYHRCPHCTKAFINASFLNAHLFRRHSEVISALQDIDLNHASLLPLDSGTSFIVEKGTNGKPPVLAPNLEQQIQEVLDHLKSQIPPPPPPPLPLTSAVVQTIEAKGAASPRASAAVEAAWRQRAAELERQLEEERDHLRQLEERNRAWQESVASQYRTDVERVKEMFEVELRNLREENLETQRELIQLRIKKANVSNFEDVEADIPEQEVRSPMPKMVTVSPPKHSSEKVRSLPSSSDSPMTKVVRNTNNAAHSVRSSCSMISRGVSCSDKIGSLDHMLHAISNVPKKRSRHQQTSDRESLSLANASIQVAPNEVTSRLVTRTLTSPQKQQALLTNRGVVVESLIVRTEDEEDGESDRTRSIHLIPFAVSTPSFLRTVLNEAPPKREGYRPYNEAELGNNKIVQLADDSSNKSEYAKERVSKSRPTTQPNAEKSHNPLQANGNLEARLKYVPLGSELRVDPLEGISHYKDQLEEFRSDPDAMKRLRKEVESLLVEQLIDHDVDGDAVGLTRGKFTETLDTLGQERQHLTRKHPNFAEIRASIARKVDRMALIALHSKRGRHDSALRGGSNGFGGGDGDVDGEGLQKKPRASRIADRDALSRPPSGRPASLTSLTHTLSPIVEYRRFATASPALRKTNPTQSKQSLFENTEDEGDDGDGRVVKVEGRTAVYRPPVVGLTACVDVATSNVNTPTTSTTPLPPKMVVSNDSTKLASKTVRIQEVDLRSKSEDSDETTAKKFHQSMNEEVDDRFQSKNQSPGHSVKFSDENEPRKNNNPDEDDDDDGPVSVFSILSEEQGDIGLSPMRPETRRGERADPVASSVTTLSPLRPGASYTISTSQWDTSSQGMTSS
ncbi:Zinc finger protein DZIP1L [Echinococcus granulosus]|uniref:Zinc finger protein DZIP1L n=1 Tax=Echinococcus granulosus TaxID=6210 RepID=W6V2X2_ECHGR|nr:Zinc finger protein DZIP1L [Echinococcus granulosus]EUB60339.1 Zinc finger protein DZIP1L [Echinococcus granulosus]